MSIIMDLKKTVLKILNHGCVTFSVITAVYALIVMLVNVEDDSILLVAGRILLFFLFSLLFSAANGIYRIRKIPGAARLLIHFLICTVAFYACFLTPLNMPGTSVMIGVVFFILFYFIAAGIIAGFTAAFRKKKEGMEEYRKQYNSRK